MKLVSADDGTVALLMTLDQASLFSAFIARQFETVKIACEEQGAPGVYLQFFPLDRRDSEFTDYELSAGIVGRTFEGAKG